MSQLTDIGFNEPPTIAFSGSELRSYCDAPPLFSASWTVGSA